MKRTKEKTEKIEEEEVRSRMFDGEVSGAMREGAARIMVEPSYVNIENLRFGRLAFKGYNSVAVALCFFMIVVSGMNSEIESMMAEHAAAMSEDKSNETDVNDAEMANRLSKTIAKKFASKRDSAGKPSIVKYARSNFLKISLRSNYCSGQPIQMRLLPCWPTLQTSLPRSGQRRIRIRRQNQTS